MATGNCRWTYTRIVPSYTQLLTGNEDTTEPPPCAPDGPCYKCYYPCLELCYDVYKCLNPSLGYPCNGLGQCADRYLESSYSSSWDTDGVDCCIWST